MKSSPKSPIAENWVVNSSPVIALGRVGQVELIARLPQKAIIPQAVKEELLNAPCYVRLYGSLSLLRSVTSRPGLECN